VRFGFKNLGSCTVSHLLQKKLTVLEEKRKNREKVLYQEIMVLKFKCHTMFFTRAVFRCLLCYLSQFFESSPQPIKNATTDFEFSPVVIS
jgi:hypothetical protein